jgi:hypothetical protein
MERFKFPDAVMKNWTVNATELLNCVIEGELSVYDSKDTQVCLRLEEWNGNLYLKGLSLSYFPAHYTISHNLCVFKLSELEIFAKKHGRPSSSHWESDNRLPTEQRNEPKQIGPGEVTEHEGTDNQLRPEPARAGAFAYDEDFRSVISRDGTPFNLSLMQAKIVEVLYKASQTKIPYKIQARILEEIDSESKTLRDLFKRKPEAWKELIEGDGSGRFRLKI